MNLGKGKIDRLVRLVARCLSMAARHRHRLDTDRLDATGQTRPEKPNAAIFDR
jgi:hypothetical protein